MGRINPASYIFGALIICDEHWAQVLEFVNILKEHIFFIFQIISQRDLSNPLIAVTFTVVDT